jgi:NAD(P) transhydrogenase subunit alpha
VDVVITTAAIPGQAAPILITEEMTRAMKPGSVIVDLAAERGGNCALTRPGELHRENGLTVIGYTNFASRMAEQASLLYARTVWNLLSHLWGDDGPKIDLADEIVTAAALVHAGEDRRSRKEA